MSLIHVMDTHLSNMIAAGEVVERPANIVKECVENALDAGAQSVQIEVFEGGIGGVIITDDGCGMDPDDAVLAFERHATSKLRTEEELFSIGTMGFRGEALPSIAAVATVDLKTNRDGQGSHVIMEFGKQTCMEEASCPRGTRIEVRNLFVKVPARYKYLRKPAYEFSVIADLVNKMALCRPDIRFSLFHDGRLVFRTSGKGDLSEILYQMYGREVAENAVPFQAASNDFVISGLAVQPKISRASKNFIYLTVNGRLIRSWQISKSIIEGYREYLPKERYPIVLLNIQADPQLVDVNVHPNKWEVRIAKEEFLRELIISTLENLFEQNLSTPEIQLSRPEKQQKLDLSQDAPHAFAEPQEKKKPAPVSKPKTEIQRLVPAGEEFLQQTGLPDFSENHRKEETPESQSRTDFSGEAHFTDYAPGNAASRARISETTPGMPLKKEIREQFGGEIPADVLKAAGEDQQHKPAGSSLRAPEQSMTSSVVSEQAQAAESRQRETEEQSEEEKGKAFFDHLKIIGQLMDSYILCENPNGLVIIDQHAAQERANFEKLDQKWEKPSSARQPLMVPLRLRVTPDLFCRLDEINEQTAWYGIEFEAFGDSQFILRQEPLWMNGMDRQKLLEDMLGFFRSHSRIEFKELRRHMTATTACHSSIRFNRPLNREEMQKVIDDLRACRQPYHCPHGRPTVITLSSQQLRKEFERG